MTMLLVAEVVEWSSGTSTGADQACLTLQLPNGGPTFMVLTTASVFRNVIQPRLMELGKPDQWKMDAERRGRQLAAVEKVEQAREAEKRDREPVKPKMVHLVLSVLRRRGSTTADRIVREIAEAHSISYEESQVKGSLYWLVRINLVKKAEGGRFLLAREIPRGHTDHRAISDAHERRKIAMMGEAHREREGQLGQGSAAKSRTVKAGGRLTPSL